MDASCLELHSQQFACPVSGLGGEMLQPPSQLEEREEGREEDRLTLIYTLLVHAVTLHLHSMRPGRHRPVLLMKITQLELQLVTVHRFSEFGLIQPLF